MNKTDICTVQGQSHASAGFSKEKLLSWLNRFMMLIILAVTIIVFSSLSPYFLSLRNFYAVGLTISVIGIVCVGQTLCILTRGFDLSVGFTAAFCGMFAAFLNGEHDMPYFLSLVISLLTGGMVGLINGALITRGKINPLITTLSTGFMLAGGVIILSEGYSIIVNKPEFIVLGTSKIYGIPLPFIVLLVLYLVFHIILSHTLFGRKIYCLGGNPSAARIAGINTRRMEMSVYIISGVLSAFAGIVLASRMGAAQTSIGSSYAMESIAASVLGGTALAGGEGKMSGTLFGVIIIGILSNGLIMLGIDQAYRDIATGLVLVLAVLLQKVNTRRV